MCHPPPTNIQPSFIPCNAQTANSVWQAPALLPTNISGSGPFQGNGGGAYHGWGQFDQWLPQCPNRDKSRNGDQRLTTSMCRLERPIAENVEIHRGSGRQCYLDIELSGAHISCILDSGCEQTVARLSVVKGINMKATGKRMYAVNSTPIPISGEVSLPLVLAGVGVDTLA